MPIPPRRSPPPGACDSHSHVFPPAEAFPPVETPSYPLPQAPAGLHAEARAIVGVERGVIVQPAPYADNAAGLLDALGQAKGKLRGVACATSSIDEATLDVWHAAGVRALRFVEVRTPAGTPYAGSVGFEQAVALAPRLRRRGWHIELWADLPQTLTLAPVIQALGVPVLLDHMGGFDAGQGAQAPAFRALLALAAEAKVGVKLTLCRRAPFGSDYSELRPFHQALTAANPGALVWGSDWPFVRMDDQAPDVGRLLDLFEDWTPDPAIRRRILVDNPAALYDFPQVN